MTISKRKTAGLSTRKARVAENIHWTDKDVKLDISHCFSEVPELSSLAWPRVTPTFDLVAKEMLGQVT
jgi:hypothetical protein